MALNVATAELIGTFLETLCYGAFAAYMTMHAALTVDSCRVVLVHILRVSYSLLRAVPRGQEHMVSAGSDLHHVLANHSGKRNHPARRVYAALTFGKAPWTRHFTRYRRVHEAHGHPRRGQHLLRAAKHDGASGQNYDIRRLDTRFGRCFRGLILSCGGNKSD